MNKLPKQHFWDWFIRHNLEFIALHTKSKKEYIYWVNELNAHLRAYFKFLHYTLHWGPLSVSLTISVKGNSRHFKKVDDLVSKAHPIPGWQFVALEQPRPIDFMLREQIEETGIDPREFRFSFAPGGVYPVGVIVYHPLCMQDNDYRLRNLAHDVVFNLLGERVFGENDVYVFVDNLSRAKRNNIEPLEKLPDAIGLRKSAILIDSKGNLIGIK